MKAYPLIGIWIVLLIAGCSKQQQETDLVTFPLKGRVVSIDTTAHRIMIAHEEIPDYMKAMTMPFKVKNPTFMTKVAPGDSVIATLAVSRTESWLETVEKVSGSKPVKVLSADDILLAHLYKVGDTIPDYPLTNQSGHRIRFSDFRGKVVALTFVYTRCPLPDFCLRMSDHFARLQKALKQDKTIAGQWHLVTISFDPKFDTPAVLASYAGSYTADLSTWDFATDSLSTITKLTDGFGLSFAAEEGLITHNLRTVVIDKNGAINEIVKGNEWTVDEIEKTMRSLMK
jgi:protein SCO1/2